MEGEMYGRDQLTGGRNDSVGGRAAKATSIKFCIDI